MGRKTYSYTKRRKYICANPMVVKYYCKKCDQKEDVSYRDTNLEHKKCPICGSTREVILE
mgnify:CR=1 FL=1